MHLILPFLASLLYVVGALLIRRSADFGVGVWRTAFVTNVISAIVFLPLWAFGGEMQPLTKLWQPALVAGLFLGGQLFSLMALTRGDVSVATPVMGIKLILVAGLVGWLLQEDVPVTLWIAAFLSTGSIVLLNLGPRAGRRTVFTIVMAGIGAACFALFDVLVQKWSPVWGVGRFLPLVLGAVVGYSFVFLPFFSQPLTSIHRSAWTWLLGGAAFISVQALGLISTLAIFGDAAAVNIVYSTRGLWSVVAVWSVGHWFRNTEQNLGRNVLQWRLAGAILMMAAVVLLFV